MKLRTIFTSAAVAVALASTGAIAEGHNKKGAKPVGIVSCSTLLI